MYEEAGRYKRFRGLQVTAIEFVVHGIVMHRRYLKVERVNRFLSNTCTYLLGYRVGIVSTAWFRCFYGEAGCMPIFVGSHCQS